VSSQDDRLWSVTPAEPWAGASYSIEVDPALEDLAGNNMHPLFDVMPGDSGACGTNASLDRIPFSQK